MTLSQKIAYDTLNEIESKDSFLLSNDIGFIFTVARDNYDWNLACKLIDYIIKKENENNVL